MPYQQDTIANIGKTSLPTLAKCPTAKAPVAAVAKAPVAAVAKATVAAVAKAPVATLQKHQLQPLQKHPYIYGSRKASFKASINFQPES